MADEPRAAHPLLLRIPPFPGSKALTLGHAAPSRATPDDETVDRAIDAIARARVAGSYWGARPSLPDAPYILMRIGDERDRRAALDSLPHGAGVLCWDDVRAAAAARGGGWATVTGVCDPWHLLSGATLVIADADDDLLVIAALAKVPVKPVGEGRFRDLTMGPAALRDALRAALFQTAFTNPFTGEATSLDDVIDLCLFWRRFIDANRPIAAAFGFAAWKRTTAAPLLWGGAQDTPFATRAHRVGAGDDAVVWKTRTDPAVLGELERRGATIVEVEDGFIRSIGLGADCVPPLSLVVDRRGIYFDPRQPSDLEAMIEQGGFSPGLLARARHLIALVADLGISKYGVGGKTTMRRPDHGRQVLVPGQVEDDRSVQCGGGAVNTNLELLRRARQDAPDAHIVYKPHPDVEAGHRVGAIAPDIALQYADAIVTDQPITALIDLVDEVHVNTSLAGFEALLRGKPVTTHGVPFYAGWGLTRDLGTVPDRRAARRSIEELVAAALLTYPRYLDPKTGLPCTAEILVRRLAEAGEGRPSLLVRLRRWQGAWKRRLAALRGVGR